MAHLSSDSLPSSFDVIIQGTGLVESILAAALARCGRTVLHLDKNSFYGGLWASLMHREFREWIQLSQEECQENEVEDPTSDGHTSTIAIQQTSGVVSSISEIVHGSEEVHNELSLESEQECSEKVCSEQVCGEQVCLSWASLDSQKRRLVYDLCPKVLACRGMMVDLLTKSGCSRYVEFKAVSKICIFQSGQVEQVPCSRADVFETKLVSMTEKRKMMKFLAHCSQFQEETGDVGEMTFMEYLKKNDLSENLIQYILLCIAMTEGTAPALEGLQAAKLFVNSLGRFDNAPFLYPIFGGGELPQAFCRCCAVFGGVYCLKRSITSLVVSEANQHVLSGITCSSGQTISCKTVICNASAVGKTFGFEPNVRISRAILLADGPVKGTQGKLTLLTIPPLTAVSSQSDAVQLLQLDASTNTAIKGTYMIHLMCRSTAKTARDDLEASIRLIYNIQDDSNCNMEGPRVLWSLYFNLDLCEMGSIQSQDQDIPKNLYVTSDPDPTRTYERAVQEAERLFKKICPDKNFFESLDTENET